eukprot:g410.t1
MARALGAVALAAAWALNAGEALRAPVPADGTDIDCRFRPTSPAREVNISITNDCGEHAKIRTCAKNFTQCVGYKSSPNYYQDCPRRIEDNETALLILDDYRSYILIDCPGWWQPGIDNWWTIEPNKSGVWPTQFTIPKHNQTKE